MPKAKLITIALALILVLALHVISTRRVSTILVSGSTSVEPLMCVWAYAYSRIKPDVRIDVYGGGSGKGILQVGSGVVELGAHSRPILDEDPPFNNVTIALANDAVLIVVNKKMPLIGVTRKALQAIFNYPPQEYPVETWIRVLLDDKPVDVKVTIERGHEGLIFMRSDLVNLTLRPYIRSEASGTAETLAAFLYGSWKAKWSGLQGMGVSGNEGMRRAVEEDDIAIGFLAKAIFNPARMRALLIMVWNGTMLIPYNGYDYDSITGVPTDESIAKGAQGMALIKEHGRVPGGYPIARELYVSLNLDALEGRIPKYIADFLTWCLTEGQEFVELVGYVRLNEEQVSKGLELVEAHCSCGGEDM